MFKLAYRSITPTQTCSNTFRDELTKLRQCLCKYLSGTIIYKVRKNGYPVIKQRENITQNPDENAERWWNSGFGRRGFPTVCFVLELSHILNHHHYQLHHQPVLSFPGRTWGSLYSSVSVSFSFVPLAWNFDPLIFSLQISKFKNVWFSDFIVNTLRFQSSMQIVSFSNSTAKLFRILFNFSTLSAELPLFAFFMSVIS